jgi:hypothetical protein
MPIYEYVCPQCFHRLEVPIPVDSAPSGGNIRSTPKWLAVSSVWFTVTKGVQACLRPFRVDADVKPAEDTQPLEEVIALQLAEEFSNHPAGADQQIWHPMHWPEESQLVMTAQPVVRAPQEPAPRVAGMFWPRSFFGWFMLVTAVQALTVVPLVWILAVVVF